MGNFKYYIKSNVTIETNSIDDMKDIVEELIIQSKESGVDFSNEISDFMFAVETDYQAYYNLDENDFEKVKPESKNVKEKLHKPRFNNCCPVCNNHEVYKSLDFPDTMEECVNCGAEWNVDDELLLDPRDDLSYDEIVERGWCIDLNK